MPKSQRLKDTIDYLTEYAKKNPNWLSVRDISKLDEIVHGHDLIDGGNSLSLGWSWYESRPSKELRQAIRALIMVSIYNKEITATGASTKAMQLKTQPDKYIHDELQKKIKSLISEPPLWSKAVIYTLNKTGGTNTRATATHSIQDKDVLLTMANLKEKGTNKVGVMLIDMQSNSDEFSSSSNGSDIVYDGKRIIDHMGEVLKAAKNMNFFIYDIVIDKDAAANKSIKALKIKTVPPLRQAMNGAANYRFMAKPSYNSFQNTPLATLLQNDKIDTLIVMGFHGNICVKNTIFGTPEFEEVVGTRERTTQERDAFIKSYPEESRSRITPNMIPKINDTAHFDYLDGLLDRNITVITSRAILATEGKALESDYGPLSNC